MSAQSPHCCYLPLPSTSSPATIVPQHTNDQLTSCLGKNLAWAEMRLFLAKVVFSFDMRLADDAPGWPQRCEAYLLWHKPALNVHLTPVAAAAAAAAAHA